MLKKFCFSLVLMILLLTLAFSQSQLSYATLEGIITHRDKLPIEGAKVLVEGTDCIGLSDESGRYVIRNIPVLGNQENFLIEVIEPNNNSIVESKIYSVKSGPNRIDFEIKLSDLFNKYYENFRTEDAFSVKETKDSNYIISGISYFYTAEFSRSNIYLLKVDRYGRKIWGRNYLIDYSFINSYVVEDSKGYLICATSRMGNIHLIKTDVNGRFLWEKVYGRLDRIEVVNNLILTDAGEYVVVGSVKVKDGEKYIKDALLVKFDENGNKVWEVIFGEKDDDEFNDIIQARNGDFIIVGTFDISGLSKGVIYRVDKSGRLIWNKKLSGEGPVRGEAILFTDQGYLIGGYAYKDLRDGFYLAYFNDKGDILWRKNYNKKGMKIFLTTISMVSLNFVVGGYALEDKIINPYIILTDLKGEMLKEVEVITKDSLNRGIRSAITTKDLYNVFIGFVQNEKDRNIWIYKTRF